MDITVVGSDPGFFDTAFFNSLGDLDADIISATSTQIVVQNNENGAITTFGGTGFTYSATDVTGGTVTSITFSQSGVTQATFTNISWPATSMVAALDALDVGDAGPLAALLSGSGPINFDATAATAAQDMDLDAPGMTAMVIAIASGFSDYLGGGSGNDSLDGAAGDDTLDGFIGRDTLIGGDGMDSLLGGSDHDSLIGGADNDTLDGGAGNDTLEGDDGQDSLIGGNNDDSLVGGADNDTLDGGIGDDTLEGGDGDDVLLGGNGDDFLNPGDNMSWDQVFAGAGNDTISFADAVNSLAYADIYHSDLSAGINATVDGLTDSASIDKGANGTTTVTSLSNITDATGGGLGLQGTAFADTFTINNTGWMQVTGLGGNDTFNFLTSAGGYVRLNYSVGSNSGINANLATGIIDAGADGVDTIASGNPDELRAQMATDTILGSSADESFILLAGDDTLDGGAGFDTVRYDRSGVTDAVTVDLSMGTATGIWSGVAFTHTLSNVESVRGSRNNDDTLIGDGNANYLDGRGGNDSLTGGLGADTLVGGAGDDTLNGGDPLNLSNADGADRFEGGDGSDWVSYEGSFGSLRVDLQFSGVNTFAAAGDTYDSIENIIGSQGADNIRGTIGEGNYMIGGRNVDYMFGRSGDDTLEGGIGDDVLFGGVGVDVLIGGANRDRAQYSESLTAVLIDLMNAGLNTGEAAGDSYDSIEDLAGSGFDDTVYGDLADNRLFGREGADSLYGRAGNDYLNGGAHGDRLDGGAGDDTLRGGTHSDTFILNGGNDVAEDFNFAHADRIAIDDNVVTVVAGMSGADIVSTYGSVVGGQVVLDFGAEGSLTIQSLSSTAGLDDEVFVF